ncbi:UDP-glucose 4-epimerase GalE [Desulfuribacillus stibiiarsenatis]|uniref:UDP-glucose 4-epimerase n=1 Tax=Desulfuribacillus stibiiarsenatis TaxID=1390249 RepID=A0A1E5L9M5_9FIRM|nr:UDP-glucose 4-epimerase GalE [Desulfuribacillus stibiiarsenatis]OEH86734.1 UDP-glucose 4-epimerase GalE [Desulfuribacillus stibiiarsenatis]
MILVVGGAGYIGSHVVKQLYKNGQDVIVFDNFKNGHREFAKWGKCFEGDLNDIHTLNQLFETNQINSVIHFAAYAYVNESVMDPQKYYLNNVMGSLNLLKAMLTHNVKEIVFSSTCATYGNPTYIPITECHIQKPINPYGWSKLMIEQVIKDYHHAYGLQYAILRYFNAAGADIEGEVGEWHEPETHLIPIILQVALEEKDSVQIFGTDYETPDGTCIRDYIHVMDLADAHIKAMNYIKGTQQSEVFNLGTGNGFSVNEVINTARSIIEKPIRVVESQRRPGDPAILIANSNKANNLLKWEPQYSDLRTIISSAWKWQQILSMK